MIDKLKVMELAQDYLDLHPDKFMINLVIKPGNIISVFLDGDNGVAIEDCIELSRQIEGNLDREEEDFELRVSSAGLDTPLKLLRQYRKNIGRELDVTLLDQKVCRGTLKFVDENKIELEKKLSKRQIKEGVDAKIELSFDEIKESKVVITFSK
ncbi:MAG: ribosome assembly cofactor RimP [Bacteroidales bacterium]